MDLQTLGQQQNALSLLKEVLNSLRKQWSIIYYENEDEIESNHYLSESESSHLYFKRKVCRYIIQQDDLLNKVIIKLEEDLLAEQRSIQKQTLSMLEQNIEYLQTALTQI